MGVFKAKRTPYFQYKITINGTPYRGSTGLDKRADAEAWLANERRKIILGIEEKKALTLSQGFAKYEIEHLQFKTSYTSIQPKINHVLEYFGGDTWLHDIGQNELEQYVAHCRTETYRKMVYSPKKKKMVPIAKGDNAKPRTANVATINRRLAAFQAMHTRARKSWRVKIQEIDFESLKIKETTVINNTLAIDTPQVLWDAAPPHIRHFIVISLSTGWRMTNVLTLNGRKQINLDAAVPFMWTVGKGDKYIETPLTDFLMQYITANGLHELECVCAQEFKKSGKRRPVKSIKTAWKNLFIRTKVKPIRIHDMRHTFGTWFYSVTRDQRAVQEALAHSDIQTSMRYTHTNLDMLREQMNKMPVRITQVSVAK